MAQSISGLPEVNYLQKKIFFTLGFLAIYRVGVHIPIPGVDTNVLRNFFQSQGANLFGMFNMFSGGALENFSVLALGIMPYISASIISQLLTVVVPHLESLSKEGEAGRKKISQYTRYGTIALALVQGTMIASSIEGQQFSGHSVVLVGGWWWKTMTVMSLTAGTAFVMWLGEQITDRGVGNGASLIIFAGIVAGFPSIVGNTYTQFSQASIDLQKIVMICLIIVAVVAFVVYVEQSARQIPVQYAKRQVGGKIYGGQASHLPMRMNASGVIPPIFASSLLQFPVTIASLSSGTAFGDVVSLLFKPGDWLYNTIYVTLIIFFAYFYTSIAFKPDDVAENLKKHGGFIPGIRPGARTAEYLHKVLTRLTLGGGIYLAAICVLPSMFSESFGVPFYFGGTSVLIVVGVALETFRQIDAHRQSLRYESFLKNGTIRSRGNRV